MAQEGTSLAGLCEWQSALMPSALVLGDAKHVREDAIAALELFEPDATFATNNVGVSWPHDVDVWVTLHPKPAPDWNGIVTGMQRRLEAGRNKPETWAHKPNPGIDCHMPDWGGSTGLFAVTVARAKGFDRIVLAGVPITCEGGHFYDNRAWAQAKQYRRGWMRYREEIAPYVRSVSGWTMETFGEPTREWINGEEAILA